MVQRTGYRWMACARSMARCCWALAVVVIWKVASLRVSFAAWQVLRTMLAKSASKVAKLCAGVPSSSVREATFHCAAGERCAGATGSRVALASVSVSANSNARQASFMCHST